MRAAYRPGAVWKAPAVCEEPYRLPGAYAYTVHTSSPTDTLANVCLTVSVHACSAIMPIAALFAVTLWLGNAAYVTLSVAMVQMLKVCTDGLSKQWRANCTYPLKEECNSQLWR